MGLCPVLEAPGTIDAGDEGFRVSSTKKKATNS